MNPLAAQQTMTKGKLVPAPPATPKQDETKGVTNHPPKKTAKDSSAKNREAVKVLDKPNKSGAGNVPRQAGSQISPSRALSGNLEISHKKVGRR